MKKIFFQESGIITGARRLPKYAPIPAEISEHRYETYQLEELQAFVQKYPKYHIITFLCEDDVCWYSNEVHFVNRMSYYLGDGNKEAFDSDVEDF